MKRAYILLAGVTVTGLLTFAAVQARTFMAADHGNPFLQNIGWHGGGPTAADWQGRTERQLGDMKARLQLTPDQEKLWPAVENAMREMQETSGELRDQMRTAMRDQRDQAGPIDPATRMRNMAAMATVRANGLQKVAEAVDPFYRSLDDSQKRRFAAMGDLAGHGHEGRGREARNHEGRGDRAGRGDHREHGQRWRNEEQRGEWRRDWQ